jgi:hypothetical protein
VLAFKPPTEEELTHKFDIFPILAKTYVSRHFDSCSVNLDSTHWTHTSSANGAPTYQPRVQPWEFLTFDRKGENMFGEPEFNTLDAYIQRQRRAHIPAQGTTLGIFDV